MELGSTVSLMTFEDMELLLDKNHSSVIIMDRDGIIQRCNQSFFLLSGYTEEDVIRKSIHQIIPSLSLNELKSENPVIEVLMRNQTRRSSEFSIHNLGNSDKGLYMLTLHDMNLCQGHSLFQRFSDSFMRDVNLGVILI